MKRKPKNKLVPIESVNIFIELATVFIEKLKGEIEWIENHFHKDFGNETSLYETHSLFPYYEATKIKIQELHNAIQSIKK